MVKRAEERRAVGESGGRPCWIRSLRVSLGAGWVVSWLISASEMSLFMLLLLVLVLVLDKQAPLV